MSLPPRDTAPIEAAYERFVSGYLMEIQSLLAAQLIPRLPLILPAAIDQMGGGERMDTAQDLAQDLASIIAGIRFRFGKVFDPAKAAQILFGFAAHTSSENKQSVSAQLRSVLKGQKGQVLALDVFKHEPWLEGLAKQWTAENVILISKLPDLALNQIMGTINKGVRAGMRHETIAANLQKSLGLPDWRAALIARDQVSKFNGALTQARHEKLGISKYKWRTVRDRRVVGRPGGMYPEPTNPAMHGNHWIREGRIFLWSLDSGKLVEWVHGKSVKTDFVDGHPGSAIQCRCWAEAQIEGLEDLIEDAPVPGSLRAMKEATIKNYPTLAPYLIGPSGFVTPGMKNGMIRKS